MILTWLNLNDIFYSILRAIPIQFQSCISLFFTIIKFIILTLIRFSLSFYYSSVLNRFSWKKNSMKKGKKRGKERFRRRHSPQFVHPNSNEGTNSIEWFYLYFDPWKQFWGLSLAKNASNGMLTPLIHYAATWSKWWKGPGTRSSLWQSLWNSR